MRARSPFRAVVVQISCGAVLAAVLLLLAHFIAPNLLANLTSPPKLLEINPPIFNCTAHAGDTIEPTFTVGNISKADVKLLGAQTSCSCTTVKTKFPVTLHPGESKHITLKVNIEPSAVGAFSRNAQLFLDREGAVPSLAIAVRLLPPSH